MGVELGVIALIGAIASAGSQVYAAQQQAKQADNTKKQAQSQQRLADIQNEKAAREQFRKERIIAANVQSNSINNGTQGSTGETGALGSLSTQADYNASTFTAQKNAQDANYGYAERNADIGKDIGTVSAIGAVAGAVGSVAYKGFEAKGGYKSLFDSPDVGDGRIHGEAPQ